MVTKSPMPLWERVSNAKTIDLSHALFHGMPISPNHPGFKMALMRRHGDTVRADGGSASNEMMMMGGHTGTHIDALCHVSHRGRLFCEVDAEEAQRGGRFSRYGVETIPPTLCRGVLLDVAALKGEDVLAPGTPITGDDLTEAEARQAVKVRKGDTVLIRSGWSAWWNDPETFLGHDSGVPGPDESAAEWLAERKIRMTGAETPAYECIHPGKGHALLPVHRLLLVESGIHIIECMNLTELAQAGVSEFLFILCPLKVVGATGVPVRPIAVIE